MSACPTCGSATVPGARFCGVCGTTLGPAAPATPTPAPPPPAPGYGAPPPPPQGAPPSPPPGAPAQRPQFLSQYSEHVPMQERSFQGNLAFLNAVPFPKGIGLFALGGAVLCALGSILPWVTSAGFSFSAWSLNLIGLVTFQDAPFGGLPTGLLYVGALTVLAPYFTHQQFPRQLVVLIGALAAGVAGFTLIRILMIGQGAGFGFGLIVSGAGGAAILYEGIKGPLRPTGAREKYVDTSKWQPGPVVQQQAPPQPAPPPPPGYAAAPPPAVPPAPPASAPQAPPPPQAPSQRFCPNCGQAAVGAFCGSCGSAIG